MTKRGISITGTIVTLAVIALIVWGLYYIVTKDYVVVRTPLASTKTYNADAANAVIDTSTTTATTTLAITTATSTATTTTKIASSTPTKLATSSSDLTVTYTDKGFSPASLSIKKGQTVTFINNSSEKMWVSANPFPSAADWPAFNEKAGVANGDSWDFTFDKTGVWFYHNHYAPAKGAKIVVSAK